MVAAGQPDLELKGTCTQWRNLELFKELQWTRQVDNKIIFYLRSNEYYYDLYFF
jgi:hypothetical protein